MFKFENDKRPRKRYFKLPPKKEIQHIEPELVDTVEEIPTTNERAWKYIQTDKYEPRHVTANFAGTWDDFKNNNFNYQWVYDKFDKETKRHELVKSKSDTTPHKLFIKGGHIVSIYNDSGIDFGLYSKDLESGCYFNGEHLITSIPQTNSSWVQKYIPINHSISKEWSEEVEKFVKYVKNVTTVEELVKSEEVFTKVQDEGTLYYTKTTSNFYKAMCMCCPDEIDKLEKFKDMICIGNKKQFTYYFDIVLKNRNKFSICDDSFSLELGRPGVDFDCEKELKAHKFCIDPETGKFSNERFEQLKKKPMKICIEMIIDSKYI